MARRRFWRRAMTCAAVLLPAALLPMTTGRAETPTVSFFVVGPDGYAVVEPYVLTWVSDGDRMIVHQSRGGLDGRVDVAVPADAAAAERVAAGRPVNLLSMVTDRKPGDPGLAATVVATSINASGIPDLPTDVGDTGGHVYTLVPGLVDFQTELVPPPYSPPPDVPECRTTRPAPENCQVDDWPDWVSEVLVPVADNLGAGLDMVATMDYQSTDRTTSSVAFSGGQAGFFEVNGGHSYTEENTVRFDYGTVGPQVNKRAYVVTKFVRKRAGACWTDGLFGPDVKRHCALTTRYEPYQGVAGADEPWSHANDTLDPALDCKRNVPSSWEQGKGTSYGQQYGLSLGPDENWATALPFAETGFLHATTTVTAETNTGNSFVRRWRVADERAYNYHYVMVKGGKEIQDRLQKGGGPGCPETSVQDAFTHASHDPVLDPVTPAREAVEDGSQVDPCDPRRHVGIPGVVGPCQ